MGNLWWIQSTPPLFTETQIWLNGTKLLPAQWRFLKRIALGILEYGVVWSGVAHREKFRLLFCGTIPLMPSLEIGVNLRPYRYICRRSGTYGWWKIHRYYPRMHKTRSHNNRDIANKLSAILIIRSRKGIEVASLMLYRSEVSASRRYSVLGIYLEQTHWNEDMERKRACTM